MRVAAIVLCTFVAGSAFAKPKPKPAPKKSAPAAQVPAANTPAPSRPAASPPPAPSRPAASPLPRPANAREVVKQESKIEFDERVVQGQRAAGAIYLFQRGESEFRSMVEVPSSFIARTIEIVLPEDKR